MIWIVRIADNNYWILPAKSSCRIALLPIIVPKLEVVAYATLTKVAVDPTEAYGGI
jgi:hypothetical protein